MFIELITKNKKMLMNVKLIMESVIMMPFVLIQLEVVNVIVNQDILEMELNVLHVLKMNINIIKQHVFHVLRTQ